MIRLVVKALALNEVRLRMRRLSTLVALLAVAAISWAMISDPASGSSLIVSKDARVLYTSSALAIGSASLACILFGLGGFFLVRGRVSEDIRSGTGGVIGATPVSNALLVFSRWLGSVAYLGAMLLVFMLTIVVLHLVRGEGPVQLHIYLQTYVLLLLPMVLFTASCATLFDSYAPLLGKAGDVLYFFVWIAQLLIMVPLTEQGVSNAAIPLIELLDFSGIASSMIATTAALQSTNIALGGGDFNPALAPVVMKDFIWSAELGMMRMMTGLLAMLPLVPAVLLFHRFSPDRVKVARANRRRSPLEVVNGWLRPLSNLVAPPLFRLGAALPGLTGQVVGDIALTFVTSPSAVLALAASTVAAVVVPASAVGPVLMAAVAFWGVLISDMSTRDADADTAGMTGAVQGGVVQRYVRQFIATGVVGLLFTGAVALRLAAVQPTRALAVLAGVACLSALASLFGRCSRSSRLFLALFLFGLYVSVNAPKIAMLDVAGFNGSATAATAGFYLMIAVGALAAGYLWNRRDI
ncbi:MAG: hypothetical protein V4723_02615 [Pseudomonadota bacterium]